MQLPLCNNRFDFNWEHTMHLKNKKKTDSTGRATWTKLAIRSIYMAILWLPSMATANINKDPQSVGSTIKADCETPKQGPQGMRGPQGPQGPQGPSPTEPTGNGSSGATGPTGNTGAIGPTGPIITIIPFASGATVQFSFPVGSVMGFGNSANNFNTTSGALDNFADAYNFAFSIPINGTITAIAAYFTNSAEIIVPADTTLFLEAGIYTSSPPTNDFISTTANAIVTLTTGTYPVASSFHAIATGLNVPVTTETRILMVLVSLALNPGLEGFPFEGYASAGIEVQ
jgi:BclB C-terminal domain-containing protein